MNPYSRKTLLPVLIALVFILGLSQLIHGQCVESPDGKTGVKFNNETSYELTFFVDEDEKVTLVPKTASDVFPAEAGEHIFRARAMIGGVAFWVFMDNEVPEKQICTWTVEDPQKERDRSTETYRTILETEKKLRNKRKR